MLDCHITFLDLPLLEEVKNFLNNHFIFCNPFAQNVSRLTQRDQLMLERSKSIYQDLGDNFVDNIT